MTININGKDIELKNTFRSLIIYENITGEVFTPTTITNILLYFYSVVMACDKDSTMSFDEFTMWLDDNQQELNNFTNWLVTIGNKNSYLSNKDNVVDNGEVTKKK